MEAETMGEGLKRVAKQCGGLIASDGRVTVRYDAEGHQDRRPTSAWPKRPDGTNMTMGEMTPEQRREQWRLAAKRVKGEFEQPAVKEKLNAILDGRAVNN